MTRTDTVVVGTLVALLALIAGLIGGPAIQLAAAPATPSPSIAAGPSFEVRPYVEGVLGKPSSVSPLTARTQADRDLVALLFPGLVRNGPGGTLVADLAERWAVDKEGKTWSLPNQGAVMRSELDGSDFEVFSHGTRNLQEFSFDDRGNLISVDNDGDHPGEKERLVYLPYGSDSGWRSNWQYGKYTDPKNNRYNVWMRESYFKPRPENQAAHILAPHEWDVLAESLSIEVDQHPPVLALLFRHLMEDLGGCRKLGREPFRIVAIDAPVLLLQRDREC